MTWIGGSQLIAACAAHTGLPTLNLGRQLSPLLFEYNLRALPAEDLLEQGVSE